MELAKDKPRHLCRVKFCRKKSIGATTGNPQHGRLCYKHKDQLYRERNPEKHLFNNLRKSAKRRGIEFVLTFAEFLAFSKDKGYLDKHGKGKDDLAIDRLDVNKGYELGNIQVITASENTAKRNWYDKMVREGKIKPEDNPYDNDPAYVKALIDKWKRESEESDSPF